MSLYRNTVWFFKGLREYTIGGYEKAAKSFGAKDLDVSCKGKVFMITGSNSGLGKAAAEAIARRGGEIHMVCRNEKLAEEAKNEIVNVTKNENVKIFILDLAKPRDVISFAKNYCNEHSKLDVLINNAGCMVNERKVDADGLEANFATNCLGTHLLTMELLPALKKGSQPRVITVSSGGMLVQALNLGDFHFEKMSPFDGTMAYAQNKRQQVILAEQYGKRFPDVRFWSCHPGWADTPAVRSAMPDFHRRMEGRLRTVDQGADTIIWLAISDAAAKQESGGFYQDRQAVGKHLPLARTHSSQDDENRLFEILEEMRKKFSN